MNNCIFFFQELLEAWQKGPENVAGAEWIIPPARGKKRKTVGSDYPYKAAFNRPGSKYDDKEQVAESPEEVEKKKNEATRLLKKLDDPKVRKAFEDWINKYGISDETLDKLRSMANGKLKDKK